MNSFSVDDFYKEFSIRTDVERILDTILSVIPSSNSKSEIFLYPKNFFNCLNEYGPSIYDIEFYFILNNKICKAYVSKDDSGECIVESRSLNDISNFSISQNHYTNNVILNIIFKDGLTIVLDTNTDCKSDTQRKLHNEALFKIAQNINL